MAKAKNNATNTINIKSEPVQAHIGSQKWSNDDWSTIAFLIDRREIQHRFADPELRYNCIYFLIGYGTDKELVYVGQAKKRNDGESVLARLREHDKSTTEKYCDQWQWIVAVTNKNDAWSLDDLNALEHAFYAEIPADQNLNGNNPNSGGADYDKYVDKIQQIKSLVTAIGFEVFADIPDKENIQVTSVINDNSTVEDLQNGMARIPEIVTPDKVVKAMVDMLPADVWNSKTTFLDPACKGGEYLREIYDRLMECELLQSEFPDEIERSNHILSKQLYGIALSQVSLERTAKKLRGFDNNIRIIPNYIEILKGTVKPTKQGKNDDSGRQLSIQDILNKEFGKTMKFDLVIGNPPYQESNGGGNGSSAGTLYDKFIVNAIDVTEQIVCMITKNNWMASDTLKTTRDKMIANKITNIINYPIVGEVFKGVDVAVSIVMLDKKSSYDTLFQEVKNTEIASEYKADFRNMPCITSSEYEYTIIKKVFTPNNFSNHIIAKLPFGIETNGKLGSTGNAPFIDESEISTDYYNIALMYMDKKSTYFSYTALDCIPKNIDIVPHYKIICGQQLNKNGNTITNINGLSSNQICSGSFSLLYSNSKKECAYHAYKYICSKFFRMLTNIMVDNMCRVSPVRFILIPEQDFTANSDIDWSQPISDIDKQLYKKYKLSQEEIDYIEKTIKPMQ